MENTLSQDLDKYLEEITEERMAQNAAFQTLHALINAGGIVRHVKSQSTYRILTVGRIESTLTPAVVYVSTDPDDTIPWIRPVIEFGDGRFVSEPNHHE